MKFLKNASYVFLANTICILVNVLVNFLAPILFNQETYSYYQLENLYCGYLWILTLGWHEGIYIYYGGKKEKEIDKKELSTQFWLFFFYLAIVSIIAIIICVICLDNTAKRYVFVMSILSVAIEAVRYIYLYYLICIDYMKQYMKYLIVDRIVYIILVITLLILGLNNYRYLIGVDILSKAVLLIGILIINRFIFFQKFCHISKALSHTRKLIFSGINVIFASFVSRFINGTVRLAIEMSWGILIFGKISLTLSISNMFTQFIQAISVVLFPALRRTNAENQQRIYLLISDLLDACMLILFIMYLPGVKILSIILPQYADGLQYMALLLPVCLFDARNIILNNTYLKALHKEKGILVSNLFTVLCSIILTYITVFIMKSLNLSVFIMVILVAIRCICSELILKKELQQKKIQNIFEELIMTFIFIFANWYISEIKGTLLYSLALIGYLIINRERLNQVINYILACK